MCNVLYLSKFQRYFKNYNLNYNFKAFYENLFLAHFHNLLIVNFSNRYKKK